MNKQRELRSLYKKHWPAIDNCMKKYPGLSAPTVIDISDAYFNSPKRLMIIGQQTYDWGTGTLDFMLKDYGDFNFGERYYSTPFWNVISKVAKILGVDRYAIAWTNLVKCDYKCDSKKGRPPKKIEVEVQEAFPVLADEISILAPDIIIFFTGPQYDDRLKKSLPGSTFEKVRNYDPRQLAKISNPNLPAKSIRTYHPNYLRRSGKENEFLKYIKRISND